MLKKLKEFSWGYVVLGLMLLAIGVCFMSFRNALTGLAISIGIILIISGIGVGVNALTDTNRGVVFAFRIAFSIICIVCGVVTTITQSAAVSVIVDVFCLLLIVDGSFKLQTAILSRRYKMFGWWVMLIISIAVIVTSFTFAILAIEDITTMTIIIGAIIIADGVQNVISSFFLSAYDKKILNTVNDTNIEEVKEAIETVEIY